MDNNTQYILAYDGDCKICKGFVNIALYLNILPINNYIPIQSLEKKHFLSIDLNRAKNEVPLINLSNNKVLYGIESILELLAIKWGVFVSLSKIKLFKIVCSFLYFIISYNRTVISSKYHYCSSPVCEPKFNLRYRLFYIIITCVISTLFFQFFLNNQPFEIGSNFRNIWFTLLGVVVIHFLVINLFTSIQNTFEYLGHLTSVFLKYSLILFILSSIFKILILPYTLYSLLILIFGLYYLIDLRNRIKSRIVEKTLIITMMFYIGFLYYLMFINN